MSPCTTPRLLFACLALALAATASAATQTLGPAADAFVSSNPAQNALGTATISNSNFGSAGALGVSAAGMAKGEFDSLLRFDFSGAKAGFDSTLGAGLWAITSIALQLTLTAPNNAFFNGNGAGAGGTNVNSAGAVAVKWMQNDSWVEGTGTPAAPTLTGITFSTLPTFLSVADESLGLFSFSSATSGNITLTLGLTPAFLADATAGSTVSLLMQPGDSAVATLADSQNFTSNATFRPVLTVIATPVPEPGSMMLIATGSLGWFAMRRRHARKA